GWPKADEAIAPWLDRLFQGEWVSLAERAAHLPLGLVQDPRLSLRDDREHTDTAWQCHLMARLLMARALQLQAKGDSRGALNPLQTTLALSRQVRHDAPVSLFAYATAREETVAISFRPWVQQVGPAKDSLRTALVILQRHQAAIPDPAENVKAQYLVERDR